MPTRPTHSTGAPRRATTAPRRLGRRPYRIALTVHVLASVGWFGVAVAVAAAALAASGTGDRLLAAGLHRAAAVAPWLSVPLGAVAVVSGAVLGVGTAHGLVRHWWVVAKVAIAAAVIVTDAAVVARVAHDAVATGAAPEALYGSTIAHVAVLAVATALSVFKPRGRTPWGRRTARSEHGATRRAVLPTPGAAARRSRGAASGWA